MDWIVDVAYGFLYGAVSATVFWCLRVMREQDKVAALAEELAQERADRTIKESNGTEPLTQACQLHIAEIKRLEAERDALREQVESVRVANSARARKGWATRKRAA
jgi:hypothetical protein